MPDSIVRVGACATPGTAWGIFVQGDFAYVADRDRVTIVSAFDPTSPWVVSDLASSYTGSLGIQVHDTLAYLHAVNKHTVVSVADSSVPYRVGWCFIPNFSGIEPKGISVLGAISGMADGDRGLQIVHTAKPDSPEVIGAYDTPGIAVDLFLKDTLAYIADLDSLQIISIADSSNPYRVGACFMPNPCYDVFVVDTFAYVACQSGFGFGSLEVVNVSDPSSPQIVASVDNIAGDPLDVWISGSYAYVAAADYPPIEGGVRVVDISQPLSPSLVASYDTPGDPRGVFAVGDLVFIADYDSLQILRHIATGINESTVEQQPAVLRLRQNQPNPFTDFTTIRYELPTAGSVTLEMYDITGRLVRTVVDAAQPAGLHTAMWDGRDEVDRKLASGIYFYRLTVQTYKCCGKMILLR